VADPVHRADTFSALSAAARAAALADPGSLSPLAEAAPRRLAVWLGRGRIDGKRVLLALTDGHDRGGTVGVEEAGALSALASAAARDGDPVIVCWDTGGVRIHDGPAALAATSAVGVGLARLALLGVPVVSVIGGPRGCFGAPAVVAATAHRTIVTSGVHWGLTGPKLLHAGSAPASEAAGRAATSAAHRKRAGHAGALVRDSPNAVRAAIAGFLRQRPRWLSPERVIDAGVRRIGSLLETVRKRPLEVSGPAEKARRRDLLQYSVRGYWRATGPETRAAHVHATWGELDGARTMAIIVGPERSHEGIGIEDAYTVARMVRGVVAENGSERAPIVVFVFCRSHSHDVEQERAGLPLALAECMKSLLVARLVGHPLLCLLGGGAYGAAYLSLAAPCHRVLAIRGTTVAPMAPRILAAFQRLRGVRDAAETPQDLARLIPEIRIVRSVVALPRVLREEVAQARAGVRPEIEAGRRLRAG
jgi:acetyl-CoA carboxylase alpha subunit